ncbi:hypothetical protein PV08_02740 [Exophiala spinifera]|uniref:Methyltransferase type 11 domain-containing protein n=1 Tax=Exophiala spinifera TaxID=91928 RepID=A0A0D2A0E3_9EURO|nr:uncharacterized protein PV08_02740 [Exophiala spinifera]KIW18452.1 hypothetical protein PV08_02740 [Exophiala spinifera]
MATENASFTQEKTFSTYNAAQGKAYSDLRRDYDPKVYQTILDQHTSTGGQLDTFLDVGCGPGFAARALAPHFTQAIGLDPAEGMVTTARNLTTVASPEFNNVRFEISTCEELGSNLTPPIADGSVDLITAANAAHWFDMPRFWAAASRVLKPGGTVAIWTSGPGRIHPSVPNAEAIQAVIDAQQEGELKPYLLPGNTLVRNHYRDLPLPWTGPLEHRVDGAFDQASFVRLDWPSDQPFYLPGPKDDEGVSMDIFEKVLATGSAATRWRQAHPDLVGTENDVLRILRRKIEALLHDAGVKPGQERLRGLFDGVILFVKKKAA